ncbi:16S rRNA (cytosine(1402)-N(4))-methyltransferase RsmH, partial [Patescibacteria group bacterium AH-259-L05]|nr:16S rRNA (cytosine(1402)-N(4))-methyltransferase RsmH [Patescibacteria group bacterium AH-259-L05]
KRLILVYGNFANIQKIVRKNNFKPVHGILLDLGLSSDLLELSGRGFSFMRDEILDMRFRPDKGGITAKEIVNHYTYEDLATIFKTYGGERYANRIADSIIQTRKKQKIITTQELRTVVTQALGRQYHIKSLARIFQALRIAVNNELENLKTVLTQSVAMLEPQGRIAVISYHSLEDKIVKTFFTSDTHVHPIVKKPITPSRAEIKKNKRSRSAKLRVAEKIL